MLCIAEWFDVEYIGQQGNYSMNESKNIQKTEKNDTTRKRRIIIGTIVVLVAIVALVKVPTIIAESGELLQILPSIPGVVSSISKGAAAEKADLKPVEVAIVSSTPRVISAEVKKSLNGFSVEVTAYLVVKETTPLTQEELLAVLTSLWKTVPFEPDSVTIRADTESNSIVDVKAAAKMLSGIKVMDYNDYTATIAQLDALLGPWKNPQ